MYRAFARRSSRYLALTAAIFFFLSAAWIGSAPLLLDILADPALTTAETLVLSVKMLTYSLFNFTPYALIFTLVAAVLFGINLALLVFYIRMFRSLSKSGFASSAIGITAATLQFGCAVSVCSPVLLTSFLGTLSGTGLIALMPYGGSEVGVAGLIFLGISTYVLASAINKPPVCSI